ncbi:AMP-binding, conserved site,AMP-binding enzyme, C-terminal domain,AMP-dependent synthetase/ligase [Cinara cedri]|uniref:AMP-binding, conserved site,AMP-binding enzyme, C-terminal domain,AMP-dependent synthetase/ligase n=1 Tax=Cinara cedri TaxID=506608 RepID=A0A5E4MH48_9HEMI|nr:AMP-binding, conserved site,AMP-binding enzyme, C-terminal domain,AMP-dependent synthetase/ligase [Cinara cedri]
MVHAEDNVLYGSAIPKYLLDSKSNLSQYFIRLLSELGNKIALIDVHDGSSFTFNNILNASFNIASWLKYECGIQKSDVVGIFSENTIWYPSIILAVWHVGGVCALFNPMYNTNELEHLLNITQPKLMITSKMGFDIVRNTAKQFNFIKYVCPINIICNERMAYEKNNFVPTNYINNQTSVILFSSGTTGLPKGVQLSHKSIYLLTSILNNNINPFSNDSDILMGLVPMFHGYGFLVICMTMSIGCKLVVLKYFDGDLFLNSIEAQKITVLFAVPPLMIFLAKHPLIDKYNLSSINAIYSGAASLSQDVQNDVAKRIGKNKHIKVLQGYGMTELSILVTMHDKNTEASVNGSVGKLIDGMAGKVIDLDNGQPLGINKSGELCFKGPMLMKSYYKNPEETTATIDAEGWLHTGDIGYYDSDYNFYIIDRLKELIKYNGYQVAPAELEALLLTHPDIEDAAVIGLPNISAGELPMAFIVKSQNSTLSEEDVVLFVHRQVSAQKRLRGGVQFVNSIPKNPSGKILRRVLKKLINTTSKL